MNRSQSSIPKAERTPLARLSEAGLQGIVGYELAQATILTNEIFDAHVGRTGESMRRVEFTILVLIEAR